MPKKLHKLKQGSDEKGNKPRIQILGATHLPIVTVPDNMTTVEGASIEFRYAESIQAETFPATGQMFRVD